MTATGRDLQGRIAAGPYLGMEQPPFPTLKWWNGAPCRLRFIRPPIPSHQVKTYSLGTPSNFQRQAYQTQDSWTIVSRPGTV